MSSIYRGKIIQPLVPVSSATFQNHGPRGKFSRRQHQAPSRAVAGDTQRDSNTLSKSCTHRSSTGHTSRHMVFVRSTPLQRMSNCTGTRTNVRHVAMKACCQKAHFLSVSNTKSLANLSMALPRDISRGIRTRNNTGLKLYRLMEDMTTRISLRDLFKHRKI